LRTRWGDFLSRLRGLLPRLPGDGRTAALDLEPALTSRPVLHPKGLLAAFPVRTECDRCFPHGTRLSHDEQKKRGRDAACRPCTFHPCTGFFLLCFGQLSNCRQTIYLDHVHLDIGSDDWISAKGTPVATAATVRKLRLQQWVRLHCSMVAVAVTRLR